MCNRGVYVFSSITLRTRLSDIVCFSAGRKYDCAGYLCTYLASLLCDWLYSYNKYDNASPPRGFGSRGFYTTRAANDAATWRCRAESITPGAFVNYDFYSCKRWRVDNEFRNFSYSTRLGYVSTWRIFLTDKIGMMHRIQKNPITLPTFSFCKTFPAARPGIIKL